MSYSSAFDMEYVSIMISKCKWIGLLFKITKLKIPLCLVKSKIEQDYAIHGQLFTKDQLKLKVPTIQAVPLLLCLMIYRVREIMYNFITVLTVIHIKKSKF